MMWEGITGREHRPQGSLGSIPEAGAQCGKVATTSVPYNEAQAAESLAETALMTLRVRRTELAYPSDCC